MPTWEKGVSGRRNSSCKSLLAETSLEHSRKPGEDLTVGEELSVGRIVGNERKGVRSCENLISQVKKLGFYSNSSKKSLGGIKQWEGCDLIYALKHSLWLLEGK